MEAVVVGAMVVVVVGVMVAVVVVRAPWILGQRPGVVEVVGLMGVSRVVVAVLPFSACLPLVGR